MLNKLTILILAVLLICSQFCSVAIARVYGVGSNTANLVVDFNDGQTFYYQVKYNGTEPEYQAFNELEANNVLIFTLSYLGINSVQVGSEIKTSGAAGQWYDFTSQDGVSWIRPVNPISFEVDSIYDGEWIGLLYETPSGHDTYPVPDHELPVLTLGASMILLTRNRKNARGRHQIIISINKVLDYLSLFSY